MHLKLDNIGWEPKQLLQQQVFELQKSHTVLVSEDQTAHFELRV